MSRGFLMFANNNDLVDYGKIALVNALMIKSNLRNNSVTLVTDDGTRDWLLKSQGDLVDKAFDHIIVRNWKETFARASERRFNDTLSTSHVLKWANGGRSDAYALSPYDETILIDCDYLVCDKSLDLAFECPDDILINRNAISLEHKPPPLEDQFLEPFGLPMYWATCVYFKKSAAADLLFGLTSHVKENYDFYRFIYGFKGNLFRNDFAISVAVHMMNGFYARDGISPLPVPTLLTSFDCDELVAVEKNNLLFYVNDSTERWRFRMSRIKNTNVHVMNKFSIIRHADRLISLYTGVSHA